MAYQKDHLVSNLKVPRPALMMVQMMEQLTEHQIANKMAVIRRYS